jgi:hypothetical protein
MTAMRVLALLIALAGVIDPAITSTRRSKPEVAVVASDSVADAAQVDQLAHELADRFTVMRAPFPNAAATVIVGDRSPSPAVQSAAPVFALMPDLPAVGFVALDAPAHTPLAARVPITALVQVSGARDRSLEVSLHANGLVVDRVTNAVTTDQEHQTVRLGFVPVSAGPVVLRVDARVAGGNAPALADLVIDVREQKWPVLFYDARPSWLSTFVRRDLERDPRFVVTSRTVTSSNVSTVAGRAPGRLGDLAALSLFDVIIVGAPEALSASDVAGLDAFMRRRGGGVVLLLDRRASGPYQRLAGVTQWAGRRGTAAAVITPMTSGSGDLNATDLLWPSSLPPGAQPVARDSTGRAILWQSPVGAGRLLMSGALDAWKFRDATLSGFDRFWQAAIATEADAAPPPIAVSLGNPLLEPGESTTITVTIRDVALAPSDRPVHADVSAELQSPEGRVHLRLWPTGSVGQFSGTLRAPGAPGTYRVIATSDGAQADAPFIVADSVSRVARDERNLLSAWTRSRGGTVFAAAQIAEVPAALERVLEPGRRREAWHPLRSAWWIVPFTLLLALEWWGRRRRGLP